MAVDSCEGFGVAICAESYYTGFLLMGDDMNEGCDRGESMKIMLGAQFVAVKRGTKLRSS